MTDPKLPLNSNPAESNRFSNIQNWLKLTKMNTRGFAYKNAFIALLVNKGYWFSAYLK